MCGGGSQQKPFNPAALNPVVPDVNTGYGVAAAHTNADNLYKKYPWLLPDAGRFAGEASATNANQTNPFAILQQMSGGRSLFGGLLGAPQAAPQAPQIPMPQAAPQPNLNLPGGQGLSAQQIMAAFGRK